MSATGGWAGRRVLVVGGGRSGLAAAALLARRGAEVRLTDQSPRSALGELPEQLERLGVELEAGGHSVGSLAWLARGGGAVPGALVVSPGVPADHPFLEEARARHFDLLPEVELAAEFIPCPWVGVTGTKGKTTTVSLIGALLQAHGGHAVVAGNIGTPLTQIVDGLSKESVLVAELSSFQLELARRLRPSVAVVLNITEDHLDRHRTMEVYAGAKARLVDMVAPNGSGRGGLAVLNAESPHLERLRGRAESAEVWTFSSVRPVPQGVWVAGGRELVTNVWNGQSRTLCRIDDLLLKGMHNVENAMAAAAVAMRFGVPPDTVAKALAAFPGVANRQEHVVTVGGVAFVNNSQGTNIDAVAKSLMSYEGSIVLIAGGRSKGAKFRDLRSLVAAKARAVVLIGEAREELAQALDGCAPAVVFCDRLEEAVERAYGLARPGDTVLLSPGCTSFDMFRNYEHRGDVFRSAARSLAARTPAAQGGAS